MREQPLALLPPDPVDALERPGILSLDLRSLALFRIAFGSVILCDLISCIPQIGAFYTDDGIMPRDALVSKFSIPWMISLHLMTGTWGGEFILFLVTLTAVGGMIMGYRTRLSTFITWLMIWSLHNRNGAILHGGDDMVRVLLFWSMFAPLNGRFSLDRALNPQTPPLDDANYSWGTQALMLQLCFVYWFTAAWKWDPAWISDGTAIYYALSLDQFAKPLGKFLLGFPDLLRVLTRATYGLELFGPALVFMPFWNARIRIFVVLSFIVFHAGIGLTMALGNFPWVCMAAWLMFLPAAVWESVEGGTLTRLCERVASYMGERVLPHISATPPAPKGQLGPVSGAIVLVCTLIVFAGSVSVLPSMQFTMPWWLGRVVAITQIGQRWTMFAPFPARGDGWFVIEGKLASGRVIDPWNGGTPTFAKPADVASTYRDAKWRKYLSNIWLDGYQNHRPYLALYLCHRWNGRHAGSEAMDSIGINYMLETTPPPGRPLPIPEKLDLWRQKCSDPAPST